uniref:Uncharacterized protein n=1 Tax=viral metagenome TaxID=1070528 RepID=A0A6C0BK40_9ZZZZ
MSDCDFLVDGICVVPTDKERETHPPGGNGEGIRPPHQCQFRNTTRMQCPTMVTDLYDFCPEHRCTYKYSVCNQCDRIVNCYTRGYCLEHADVCRCQHTDDLHGRCTQRVEYPYYHTGCRYCSDHRCWVGGCKNEQYETHYHMCQTHFHQLPICDFIDGNGNCHRCINIVDEEQMTDQERHGLFTGFCTYLSTMERMRYCRDHTCQIPQCKKRIRNQKSPWCNDHSIVCHYPRCENIVSHDATHSQIYCAEHICHWVGFHLSDPGRCQQMISKQPGSSEYCEIHYRLYSFYKDEYSAYPTKS